MGGGCFSFIDRTSTINLGLDLDIITPVPLLRNPETLEYCIKSRAESIINENSLIHFYWSGDIDSTCALSALIKYGVRPNQIEVRYSEASVFEYPEFFAEHVRDKLPCKKISGRVIDNVDTSALIVTGEFGDQLFGSVKTNNIFKKSPKEAKETNWKDCLHFSDELMSEMEQLMLKCPFKIDNSYDALWWINFIGKWQHVECRMANHSNTDFITYLKNCRHFFKTEDFQVWSMAPENQVYKISDTWATYKLPLKKFILSFTGHDRYFRDKTKVGSLPTYAASHFLMRLKSGKLINFGRDSSSKVAFNKLFNESLNYVAHI